MRQSVIVLYHFFFQVRQDTCLFINIWLEPIMVVLGIEQTKKNKQTNNNRFLVVGLLYEILVIVCSILDWYSLHYLLQFSKLWEERKKKKYLLLALAVGLTPHNYFTAVKHECTEWFLNPNMSHYFYNP